MTISNLETARVNGPCNCADGHGLQETEVLRQMIFGPDCATPSCREGWRQARAVIAVIAERQGVDHA